MKKVIITGGKGQLAMSIKEVSTKFPDYQFFFADIEELDITNRKDISKYLDKEDYYAIINCAAYTQVDLAEQNQEMAYTLNSIAVSNLVEEANKRNIHIIHISTDYVFGSNQNTPYKPHDITQPKSIYGKTKLGGENYIINHSKSGYIIIRTSWLYSEFGNNFLKTMIRLGSQRESLRVIYDQIGTPTYGQDLGLTILSCLSKMEASTSKIFHYSNQGVCSWYDFAKKIMEIKNIQCKVIPILTSQYPSPAPRPYYSVMDKSEIRDFLQIEIPHWEDSLKVCIKNLDI